MSWWDDGGHEVRSGDIYEALEVLAEYALNVVIAIGIIFVLRFFFFPGHWF